MTTTLSFYQDAYPTNAFYGKTELAFLLPMSLLKKSKHLATAYESQETDHPSGQHATDILFLADRPIKKGLRLLETGQGKRIAPGLTSHFVLLLSAVKKTFRRHRRIIKPHDEP